MFGRFVLTLTILTIPVGAAMALSVTEFVPPALIAVPVAVFPVVTP
jgi:hypothetical protein